jgi:Uncharacterised conserved protein (DUF2228)
VVSQVFNRRLQLRQLYGFDFPEDLFRFWGFINRLAPLEPLTALADTAGLHLVGPFEVLAGHFDERVAPYHQHLHWRYADDPPEFFTVFTGNVNGLHYGYYLDDPSAPGGCIAAYYADDAFELEANCDTLFEAVRLDLEQSDRDCTDLALMDPESAGQYAAKREEIARVRATLCSFATGERRETGEQHIDKYLEVRPARWAGVVAATHEGMGIVVPPATYRPVSVADRKLWRTLRKPQERNRLIDEARSALGEGFPGTALKLGKELWATRDEQVRNTACELLDAAYAVLGREVLREVLRHHREHPHLPYVDILHVDGG